MQVVLISACLAFASWAIYLGWGLLVFVLAGRDPTALDHAAEFGRDFPLHRRKRR